jgi:hypothetical protein
MHKNKMQFINDEPRKVFEAVVLIMICTLFNFSIALLYPAAVGQRLDRLFSFWREKYGGG